MTDEQMDALIERMNRQNEGKDPASGYTRLSEKREALMRQQAQFSLSIIVLALVPSVLGWLTMYAFEVETVPPAVMKAWVGWLAFCAALFGLGQLMYSARQNALK